MKCMWIPFVFMINFLSSEAVAAVVFFYLHLPMDGVEKTLLEKPGFNTVREGNVLTIQTAKGAITFEDRIDAGEGSATYRLVGILQGTGRNFALVRVSRHEVKGYELVNRETGKTIFLYNIPKFSEDWRKFADVSLDLEAGYMPNLIRIFKLDDSGYVKEWEYLFPEWEKGPTDPIWLSNSAIVFFESTYEDKPSDAEIVRKPFMIELENGEWTGPRPL